MHLVAAIENYKPLRGPRLSRRGLGWLLALAVSWAIAYKPQTVTAALPFTTPPTVSPAATPTTKATLASATTVVSAPQPQPASLPSDTSPAYPNHYAFGNCTWYVANQRPVPPGWGNASNWAYAAQRAGWKVTSVPVIGAIAWTPAGWSGHVALVKAVSGSQVLISEMNNKGFDLVDQRWVPVTAFRYLNEY